MPAFSIIIPFYNAVDTLGDLLASLEKSSFGDVEIICVDDCSTDDSADIAAEAGAGTVRMPERSGPAAARNRGAAEASGGVLLFLDADVLVEPGMVGEIAKAFRTDEEIVAAVGVYDSEPANAGFWPAFKAAQSYYFRACFTGEDITWFWGAMGAVRSGIFESVGGFDESYTRPGLEDVELGRRLARSGKIRLVRRARVRHHFTDTLGRNLRGHFSRGLQYVDLLFADRKFDNYLSTPLHAFGKLSAAAATGCFFLSLTADFLLPPVSGPLGKIALFFAVSYLITIAPFFLFTWRRYSLGLAIGGTAADLLMAQALGLAGAIGVVRFGYSSLVSSIRERIKQHTTES